MLYVGLAALLALGFALGYRVGSGRWLPSISLEL